MLLIVKNVYTLLRFKFVYAIMVHGLRVLGRRTFPASTFTITTSDVRVKTWSTALRRADGNEGVPSNRPITSKKIEIRQLCGREFSHQTVSNLTERLDEQVRAWAERPFDEEYPFLLADAMQLKIRRDEAVRSAMALIIVGTGEDGYREILGFKIALRETAESWRELLKELKDRGPRGRGTDYQRRS
nr:transposase [Salinibacter ruber]